MQHDIQDKLLAPFEDSDIEWRLQHVNKEKGFGIAVPYVTNRAIQQRLDKAVGADGWKNEYIPWHSDGEKQSQLCGISIYFEDRKEWVTKYDGAEDSDIEPVKGGLSDSMKRAAVQWGVGRYLYSMGTVYVDVEKRGETHVISKGSYAKLDDEHQRTVKKVFGAGHTEPQAQSKAPQAQELPQKPPQQAQQPLAQQQIKPIGQAPPAQTRTPQPPKAATEGQQPREAVPRMHGNSCCVINAAIVPALNGQNTLVQLKGADGKVFSAYMQGTNPVISSGVWLDNANISKKVNEGVIFYTLDSFEIRAPKAA